MTEIPFGWRVAPLSALGARVTSGSRGWAKYYARYGSLFVRITNLTRQHIGLDLTERRYVQVSPQNAEAKRTRLASGDLLVSITADIGIIGFVDETVPKPAYINQHIARVRLDPSLANTKFVAYYLSSWAPQRRFVGATDTGAKAGMNLATVAALTTVVPPLAEQARIADALTDADAHVATLARLIAKKEAIKKGAVQELFTGRIRLAGHRGAWTDHRLDELGVFLKGRGIKRDDVRSSGVPCIRYGELYTSFRDYTAAAVSHVAPEVAETALPLKKGDLLFAGSGETRDEIGKCVAFVGEHPTVAGGDIVVLRSTRVNSVYVGTLVNTPHVADQRARLGQGDAVVHISSRALGSLAVTLPPRSEQDAIARVLMDADSEIDALRRRLAKATAIRQGMVQQLLTGRTRLPALEGVA